MTTTNRLKFYQGATVCTRVLGPVTSRNSELLHIKTKHMPLNSIDINALVGRIPRTYLLTPTTYVILDRHYLKKKVIVSGTFPSVPVS